MDLGLRGRHALVCGSSRGIGRACAEVLAGECGEVTICARNGEGLADAAQAIGRRGDAPVHEVVADLSSLEGARSLVAGMVREPDIVVLSSPRQAEQDPLDLPVEGWNDVLESGVLVAVELLRAFVPGMVERGFGRIVYVTGSVVKAPAAQFSLSNVARGGLLGLLAGMARGPIAPDVTVNSVLVGFIDTPGLQEVWQRRADKLGIEIAEYARERVGGTPAGRLGTPEEVASLCAYLCSSAAGFVTGQTVLCDGGRTTFLV